MGHIGRPDFFVFNATFTASLIITFEGPPFIKTFSMSEVDPRTQLNTTFCPIEVGQRTVESWADVLTELQRVSDLAVAVFTIVRTLLGEEEAAAHEAELVWPIRIELYANLLEALTESNRNALRSWVDEVSGEEHFSRLAIAVNLYPDLSGYLVKNLARTVSAWWPMNLRGKGDDRESAVSMVLLELAENIFNQPMSRPEFITATLELLQRQLDSVG